MKVGIIGYGVVGQAQARMFGQARLVIWDPKHPELNAEYPAAELATCDFAVISVDTPADGFAGGRQDAANVLDAYKALPHGLPTMIRSTVLPGTTDYLIEEQDRDATTVFVPEFLTERPGAGWQESTDVPWLLLGGAPEDRAKFLPWLRPVLHHRNIHECQATTAELAKYTANLYWATRVTFVNEMSRICEVFGGDWERVRSAWLMDQRVRPPYTRMEGFPSGFGGACWPKDLRALITAASDEGYWPHFLDAIEQCNERFSDDQLPPR
jgi:UDPglucose 6-dehydrogenase